MAQWWSLFPIITLSLLIWESAIPIQKLSWAKIENSTLQTTKVCVVLFLEMCMVLLAYIYFAQGNINCFFEKENNAKATHSMIVVFERNQKSIVSFEYCNLQVAE